MSNTNNLTKILDQFLDIPPNTSITFKKIKTGHINTTYKVQVKNSKYILQKLNSKLFNKKVIEDSINTISILKSSEIPTISLIQTKNKRNFTEFNKEIYRMMEFIEHENLSTISKSHILKMTSLLAKIHNLFRTSNFHPSHKIKGFRKRESYLSNLNLWYEKHKNKKQFEKETFNFIKQNFQTNFFKKAKNKQLIHGDVRVDNFLYNPKIDKLYIIDLDTSMRDSKYIDIGDFGRSVLSKTPNPKKDLLKEIFNTYNKTSNTHIEWDLFLKSINQISLELLIRYFTDYLGNNYFRVTENKKEYLKSKIQQLQSINNFISKQFQKSKF